jgi:toxin ParE1/3/4
MNIEFAGMLTARQARFGLWPYQFARPNCNAKFYRLSQTLLALTRKCFAHALAAQSQDEFDRIFDFLFEYVPDFVAERIAAIIVAIDVLETSPRIGRSTDGGKRELIISTGASGYVALYQYLPELDTVFVLAIRRQREAGYGK